jgi:hypothetical protein
MEEMLAAIANTMILFLLNLITDVRPNMRRARA